MLPRDLHLIVLTRAVAPLHGVGGLERHGYDLIAHLLERGVRVTLITQPPTVGLAPGAAPLEHPHLTIRYVPYVRLPLAGRRGTTVIDRSTAYPLFGWRAGRLAAALVRQGGVHVVHGMGAASLGFAHERLNDWYATVPFVFNPHGMEEFGSTGPRLGVLKRTAYAPLRRAVRVCANAADRVVATDRSLVSTVVGHLGIAASRVSVVPNAVDLARIDRFSDPEAANRLRQRLGISRVEPLLLSVGRLEHNKGFQNLIGALAKLNAHGAASMRSMNWRAVILGEGSYRADLEKAVQLAGLGDRIVMPGSMTEPELHGWYEAATLFVHPTLYEGSSIATLEAMSHRRTVVATAAGGLPDKVRPGENGWLVAPGDVDGLARAVSEALERPDVLVSMGERSRQIVEEEFAWTAVIQQVLALYDEILSGHAAA